MIEQALQRISAERMRRDLFHLCRHPLPFRKANYTRPGQPANSLAEADAYISGQLAQAGYEVVTTAHRVQAFRCDTTKPLHHWYSAPDPADPFYDVANLEATRPGGVQPDEIVQLISHKDSMSWIDSPGAHDNAVGTVVNLELARVLATCSLPRSVRLLFCNEEHTPWTSRFAAEAAAARGDRILAVLNVDGVDGKSDEDMAAGKRTHAIGYSTPEGHLLAERVAACAARYGIDLDVQVFHKEHVNDDDGMFINAGFRT
ncbi:MAG: M28 family peptidase, partial [Candidatus Latescibacterota bacterium]